MLNKIFVSSPIRPNNQPSGRSRLIPTILITSGVICLLVVFFPILKFYFYKLVYPVPTLIYPFETSVYPPPIVVGTSGTSFDQYSQASSWFIKTVPLPSPAISKATFFSISIPEIGLSDVTVEINGQDLKKNAIHYPGTPLPGNFGNVVIFGHSALPQLFRLDDPLTIFNPLLQAKVGHVIEVGYDNYEYTYRVTKITEVNPDQIEVLAQNYSNREITLITCVPLGTYWHRLVVRAELAK